MGRPSTQYSMFAKEVQFYVLLIIISILASLSKEIEEQMERSLEVFSDVVKDCTEEARKRFSDTSKKIDPKA